MKLETIQSVILQSQKRLQTENEEHVVRELQIESIPKEATVLIGIRRAGKSTHLKDFLINSVSDKTLVCYLDFADDRLVDLQHEEPGQIAEAYYQLHVI